MLQQILTNYNEFYCKNFQELKFSYFQYCESLETLNTTLFEIKQVGKSFLGKEIFQIKFGIGDCKIFMWSQMHGNEPISTQGLMDFLFFLNTCNSELQNSFFQRFTIYAIPLLNPDGAELFQRRNAQEIDLNRDANKLVAPESQLLWHTVQSLKPHFAFNLHDQERYYGNSLSDKPTAISLLAPSFDFEKTVDENRLKSMQLVTAIFKDINFLLPNSISKYNDSYMPTAFGDSIQKLGISTILLEAGFIVGDDNRQLVKKYYFASILSALLNLLFKNHLNYDIEDYNKIPTNIKLNFVDFLIKNIKIEKCGKIFVTDIAIIKNILDTEKFTDLCKEYIIWDIGDLGHQKAFKTIDAKEITINKNIKRLDNADSLLQVLPKININEL